MCGRFVQAQSAESYAEHFGAALSVAESWKASWNVAPTDRVLVVAEHDGTRLLGSFQWGLVPWFARDAKGGARHINARVETAATAPSFRDSFARKRCLIPADGFYEWERLESGGKLPHFIHAVDGAPLALAGLWASWQAPDGERVATCTILTTRPDPLVAPIHDRMPVILERAAWDRWLDRDTTDPVAVHAVVAVSAGPALAEYAVSSLVNDVRNNYPECVARLA